MVIFENSNTELYGFLDLRLIKHCGIIYEKNLTIMLI